jgi:hypothetical protein
MNFDLLIVAVVAPVILFLLTDWRNRKTRKENWAREDLVAERVLKSSATLLKVTKETSKAVQKDIAGVHFLVNSDKTAGMEAQLVGFKLALASTNMMMLQSKRLGEVITTDVATNLELINAKILELETELQERERKLQLSEKLMEGGE